MFSVSIIVLEADCDTFLIYRKLCLMEQSKKRIFENHKQLCFLCSTSRWLRSLAL